MSDEQCYRHGAEKPAAAKAIKATAHKENAAIDFTREDDEKFDGGL